VTFYIGWALSRDHCVMKTPSKYGDMGMYDILLLKISNTNAQFIVTY
jgi:hypothetical protein